MFLKNENNSAMVTCDVTQNVSITVMLSFGYW